jgi:hypothetical protein
MAIYAGGQKITPQILTAIRDLMNTHGWYGVDLAARIGVSPSGVSNWLNGRAKSINPKTWAILHPMIEPHLSDSSQSDTTAISQRCIQLAKIFDQLDPESQFQIEHMIRSAAQKNPVTNE